ncbi:alpha/beta hydrolase [Nocardia bovistercoris]|uniref:Alpha/beta fold hydrolase n=1 Tax=Nocardia bovistercoris TaxID=2785916 RepID=A0A931IF70_9NOCA|nr:alpha/beta hydrolase [Nocardia bovistercoris]MBH0778675.1 alpha/beta fold hydrolase [Nocardia bovistercoris]
MTSRPHNGSTCGFRRVSRVAGAAVAVWAIVLSSISASAEAAPRPDFGACPDGAVTPDRGAACAVLEVPLDYAEPGGPTIELTVSRIAATGVSRGAIFANPGGPGGDALNFWAERVGVLPDALYREFDLVAVQPRGLRWSTPLDCGETKATDPQRLSFTMREDKAHGCADSPPGYRDTVTTENTARDMDAVRAALGLRRVNFLGVSYGTYLGAVYATMFGARVDRMVLDSNVNPDWVWTEEFAVQQVAIKRRLDDLFAWIAENDAEYRLGGTALQVYRNWVRLVTAQGGGVYANLTPPPASAADLPVALPEPLAEIARDGLSGASEQANRVENLVRILHSSGAATQGPLLGATVVAAYARAFWPRFASAMADVDADPANVGRLQAMDRAVDPDATARSVFSAITCNENAVAPRPELVSDALATIASGGNVMDARADIVRSGKLCESWPPVARPVPISGADLDTPPLLLQSRYDPMTEYRGGPALARAVDGSLVTVEGGDHGVFGRGNPAVDDAVVTYLRTGRVEITHAAEAPLPPRP